MGQRSPAPVLIVWCVFGTSRRGEKQPSLGHGYGHSGVSFSPDGKTLASGNVAEVRLWDVGSWTERAVIAIDSWDYNSVSFSPDSRTLATIGSGDNDNEVHLWNVATGKRIGALKGHTKARVM